MQIYALNKTYTKSGLKLLTLSRNSPSNLPRACRKKKAFSHAFREARDPTVASSSGYLFFDGGTPGDIGRGPFSSLPLAVASQQREQNAVTRDGGYAVMG